MYRILSGIGYFLGIGPPLFGVFAAGAICAQGMQCWIATILAFVASRKEVL